MKKYFFALTLSLVLFSLCSCGTKTTPTPQIENEAALLQEIEEKNQISSLLSDHEVLIYSQTDLVSGDMCYRNFFKDENGRVISTEIWNMAEAYLDDISFVLLDDKGLHFTCNLNDEKYNVGDFKLFQPIGAEQKEGIEKLVVNDKGNYEISQSFQLSEEDVEGLIESWNVTTDDFMETVITVDQGSLILTGMDYQIRYGDGAPSQTIAKSVVRFKDKHHTGIKLQEFLTGELCHLTVYLPNGEEESWDIPKGAAIEFDGVEITSIFLDSEYKTNIAKEQLAKPMEQDMILYCKERKGENLHE